MLAATVGGALIPGSPLEPYFSLSRERDDLRAGRLTGSSRRCCRSGSCSARATTSRRFLKIGTIVLLVVGVIVANPKLEAPAVSPYFAAGGGPYFDGPIFPYVFICIMCGAISGFHALVSSGTTPKMVDRESDVRMIGYGAMLMEGLVGVVALIAAAALPNAMYYDINIDLARRPEFLAKHRDFAQVLEARSRPARRPRAEARGGQRAGGDGEGRPGVAPRPDRRRGHAGRRHGADLLRRHARA